MVTITERDLSLLAKLGDYELLTTKLAGTIAFGDIDKATVLRRLRKLERAKLIRRTHGLASGEAVWMLAQQGARRIGRDSYPDGINRNSLEHDVTLSRLRHALEAAGIAQHWNAEQKMRRASGKAAALGRDDVIPDAVFAARRPSGNEAVAFELELSGKNNQRYHKLFLSYRRFSRCLLVWYAVGSAALGKRLAREWEKVNAGISRPQFGWTLAAEILADPLAAVLRTGGQSAPLGGIFLPAHTPAQPVSTRPAEDANEIRAALSA